jgi:hypothetical protein
MPDTISLITAINASAAQNQGKICRVKSIIPIDLHKKVTCNIDSGFEYLSSVLYDLHKIDLVRIADHIQIGDDGSNRIHAVAW